MFSEMCPLNVVHSSRENFATFPPRSQKGKMIKDTFKQE